MRNPNRTTKGERRFVRRYNPYAARTLGIAQAARWYREGVLLDEARGFDNLVNDLKYGPVPLELNDLVNAAIDGQRDRLERILGIGPGMLTPTGSNVNHHGTHTGYEVSDGPNPHITLKYPMHISVPYRNGARQADATFAALYQAYRKGREAGEEYLEWNGDPWHDPNEVAAVHAEAIEHALNDDIDPGD